MFDVLKRHEVSDTGTGTRTASIPVGAGAWVIDSAAVTIGGSTTIIAAMPVHMSGRIVYEQQDEYYGTTSLQIDDARSLKLASGIATEHYPLIMERPHVIIGPGQIVSRMNHAVATGGFEHTLAVSYRRYYPNV